MATGAALRQQQSTTQTPNAQSQFRRQGHTFNVVLPANWGYQEFAAINWIAGQLSQISSQYLVGLSGAAMGGSSGMIGVQSGMVGQNSAVNGETTGSPPERRGRRKMTPAQRAAHAERMRASAARRKQEKAATAQAQQKTKGKTAAAGAG